MRARRVLPETLDRLAPDDPRAQRARQDLRRINRLMGARGQVERTLRTAVRCRSGRAPLRILELGAGDGSLMLAVAGRLSTLAPATQVTLLDSQRIVADETVRAFARLGWAARTEVADVADWAASPEALPRWDAIVANLFLHHFETAALARLLAAIAQRSELFLACEPRRGWLALAGSHLVGLVGASAVTRQDAVLSVHAGFRAAELSALWRGDGDSWHVEERAVGFFSHRFLARRARPDAPRAA